MPCKTCEHVRRMLPGPFANGLRGIEEGIEARRIRKKLRKQQSLSAALAISKMVPPNVPPPCEHGRQRDEACPFCRASLDSHLERDRAR